MKLAIRIFAAVVVLAGAAAIATPSSAHAVRSSQAVSAAMPGPACLCPGPKSSVAVAPAILQ